MHMDGYSGKRAGNGVVVPRKGSGLVLRDNNVNQRDRNATFCSRIGCSSRLNTMKGTQIGGSEKAKSSIPSYRSSSSGKEIIGSSSRAFSAVSSTRKSSANSQKKLLSQLDTDSSETSSVLDEPEVSELITPPGKIQKGFNADTEDAASGDVELVGVRSSNVALSARSRRNFDQRSGLGNQDTLPGSSLSLAHRSTNQTNCANAGRYGPKNLRCNLISDVVQSGCSSSDSILNRRKDMIKKRISDGEGSSSGRGKKMNGSLSEGRTNSSSHGVSISDSGRTRKWPANRDTAAAASFRTRRSISGYGRTRLSNQGNGSSFTLNESNAVIPQVARPEMLTDVNASSSPELTSPCVFNLPGTNSEGLLGILPSSPSELDITRTSITRESFRRYNMDGIAEVLLALERMEQDEVLTYEQLLVLETSLLLNGLSFYDQHRDMRLDIDNMTYEELLALEERMGTVSTALSEEAMSECLKTSIYEVACEKNSAVNHGDRDDIKCSICQEEYVGGDELGSLRCEHRYHVACIHQWLRVKNWCPICKASAEHSPSPLLSSSPTSL